MDVCLRAAKESNKSRFDSYSIRNSVLIISHVTFRDCRVHIFSDNLSGNNCIQQKQRKVCIRNVTGGLRNHKLRENAEKGNQWQPKVCSWFRMAGIMVNQLYPLPLAEIQLLSTFLGNNVYCSVYSLSRPE